MMTYVVLLRGINVAGKNKIAMAELKKELAIHFDKVLTYIQSGNLVIKSTITKDKEIQDKITKIIAERFELSIEVLAYHLSVFQDVYHQNPFKEQEKPNSYYCLLKEEPDQQYVTTLRGVEIAGEEFHLTKDCVYLVYQNGYGRAKINNNYLEKHLKVIATTRNHRTMQKLLTLAAEI